MGKQLIISISREFGSGGHLIAEKIASDLGLPYYNRKMLDEIAENKNIHIEYIEKYDEKPKKIIISRRVNGYSNSFEEVLADMQFEFIREKADLGQSFVIVGRCAETVLKGHEGLVSIFVSGDKEDRIQRVMERDHLEYADAKKKMVRHDITRKQYHNRHSDQKWGDSRNYDLCINSSRLGIEKTTKVLENYIKERMTDE